MSVPFKFIGHGPAGGANWEKLQRILLDELDQPENYITEDQGLIAAVNTALTLGMPLLLTGEPGVGKTQLGYRIAYELACNPIAFSVKSSTEAPDLFYQLDHLRRLHAVQSKTDSVDRESIDVRRFLQFKGLGLAILRAMPEKTLRERQLWEHAWPESERSSLKNFGKQQASVLIIDEIDKAPMDFCNDILEEIRLLKFTIPELGAEPLSIYADPENPEPEEKKYRPQIIITSNSAKSLPEAFLRRCIYYQIPVPDPDQLNEIINRRLLNTPNLTVSLDNGHKQTALAFFNFLKSKQSTLNKPPSTAELLDWLLCLDLHFANRKFKEIDQEDWKNTARFCLFKHEQDIAKLEQYYQVWRDEEKKSLTHKQHA